MIRGINSQPYINLDPFLDIEGLKKLHYRICKGIVLSENKKEGNVVRPGGFDNAYKLTIKPTFQAVDEYFALPEDHEIRIAGREIGEWKNRDQFVLYLKLALGAYDPYQFIFLKTEEGGWETMDFSGASVPQSMPQQFESTGDDLQDATMKALTRDYSELVKRFK